MSFAFLSLITIIPALAFVWGGEQLAAHSPRGTYANHRSLYLLLACVLILLYFSFYAHNFEDGDFPWLVLILLPALEGLLALILVARHELLELWETNRIALVVFSFALLALFVYVDLRAGVTSPVSIVMIAPALLTAFVWELGGRLRPFGLAAFAVGLGIFLGLDAVGGVASPLLMGSPWRGAYAFSATLAGMLALAVAAVLVARSLKVDASQARRLLAPAVFVLLALAASEVRHGVLAKATGRAAEDHTPIFLISAAVLAGVVLFGVAATRHPLKRIAFLILVPALIASAYTLGWTIDPQAITTARAGWVAQAIQRYHQERGEYPQALSQLAPGYIPYLLGPLSGRGQVWCYQSGADFYRLGYVYFQRYYFATRPDPFSEVRILASAGQAPPGEWMCDVEHEKYLPTLGL